MSKNDFDEFVKRQQAAATKEARVDWGKMRDQWLSNLDALYEKLNSFLRKYVDDGLITTSYEDIEINEERVGRYAAKRLVIGLGQQALTLTPIGTNLIGAWGRVDLEGPAGKIKIVLVDRDSSAPRIKVSIIIDGESAPEKDEPKKDIVLEWRLTTPPPAIRYIDLTQETFFEAIMEVANG